MEHDFYTWLFTTRKLSLCDPSFATSRDNSRNRYFSLTSATVDATVLKLSQRLLLKWGNIFTFSTFVKRIHFIKN
jgi:hypothetical protein